MEGFISELWESCQFKEFGNLPQIGNHGKFYSATGGGSIYPLSELCALECFSHRSICSMGSYQFKEFFRHWRGFHLSISESFPPKIEVSRMRSRMFLTTVHAHSRQSIQIRELILRLHSCSNFPIFYAKSKSQKEPGSDPRP